MGRIRITIAETGNRGEDLRVAARLRTDLWENSRVEAVANSPLRGTHFDENGRAYFEYATDFPGEVRDVLRAHEYGNLAVLNENPPPLGQACENCGNIAGPHLPLDCPNCRFRDITPCPICDQAVSRLDYIRLGGDLFRCPHCGNRVRLRYNEPMFDPTGLLRSPLVLVERTRE